MKALVVSCAAFWENGGIQDAEIMLRLKEKDAELFFLQCDGNRETACPASFFKENLPCKTCRFKLKRNFRITGLDRYIKEIINLDPVFSSNKEVFPYHEFKNIKELMQFEYQGIDIGRSIASVLITTVRNSEPELTADIQRKIHLYINELIIYTNFLQELVNKYGFDEVYIGNGRNTYFRVALRVMQQNKIDVFTHDVYPFLGKYDVKKNSYVHSNILSKKDVDSKWKIELDFQKKEKSGDAYFDSLRKGTSEIMPYYVAGQKRQESVGIKKDLFNVAIFISSEDEFVTIKEKELPFYKNQNDALQRILKSKWKENIHFIIRVHPNLKNLKNAQTEGLKKIYGKNITIIPAESDVSTYQLLEECDLVVVFLSTVGIEACYSKKPVIILGSPSYLELGNFIKPESHEALCDYINNFNTIDFHIEENYLAALKYAWYMQHSGVEFKYYSHVGFLKYKYLGKKNGWYYYYQVREFNIGWAIKKILRPIYLKSNLLKRFWRGLHGC